MKRTLLMVWAQATERHIKRYHPDLVKDIEPYIDLPFDEMVEWLDRHRDLILQSAHTQDLEDQLISLSACCQLGEVLIKARESIDEN